MTALRVPELAFLPTRRVVCGVTGKCGESEKSLSLMCLSSSTHLLYCCWADQCMLQKKRFSEQLETTEVRLGHKTPLKPQNPTPRLTSAQPSGSNSTCTGLSASHSARRNTPGGGHQRPLRPGRPRSQSRVDCRLQRNCQWGRSGQPGAPSLGVKHAQGVHY